ncbi:hypothetical protein MHB84_04760 [Paenibacillus sp. FSL F4-0087]|uniref:Lipoprotein n=1 Tax=Paenibacillus taichungensis TaxID=484184 RepID=A0ABX2MWX4_9BACL|nr:hypothetical protein [Paenibacillus taichungensis]NUU58571.1 hypothetical protein [Paenibacillus taichungensis]OME81160.1 hypothetical protein BK122_17115 [Paenibacillus pabuli]
MKKLTVLSLLFLFLIACQDKTTHEAVQKPTIPVTESVTDEAIEQKDDEAEAPKEDKGIPPVYLDETKYTGDELEIVKLMNVRMRYIWEEDEEGYMSLFDPQSPVSGIPVSKVRKVISMSKIKIREQKKLYEALVMVTELRENGEEFGPSMVFWKKKADGDAAKWIFADID